MHGAAAGQVQRKAAERVAQAKALAVYQRCSRNGDGPVDVLAELEHLVGVVTHFADFAESRLAALGEDDWRLDNPAHDQTIAEVRTFERAQQAAAQLLTEVVRLDLYGRQVAQAKQIAAYVSEVIESVFVEAGFSWRSDGIRASVASPTPGGRAARRRRVSETDFTPCPAGRDPGGARVPQNASVAERAPPGTTPTSWLTT